jgi:hypothetical protein
MHALQYYSGCKKGTEFWPGPLQIAWFGSRFFRAKARYTLAPVPVPIPIRVSAAGEGRKGLVHTYVYKGSAVDI